MDNERVLEKIEELMALHGYTRYKLARLSGISKSISSIKIQNPIKASFIELQSVVSFIIYLFLKNESSFSQFLPFPNGVLTENG